MPLPHIKQSIDDSDLYATMTSAVQQWMETHHPEAKWVVLVAEFGDGKPSLKVPVFPGKTAEATPVYASSETAG